MFTKKRVFYIMLFLMGFAYFISNCTSHSKNAPVNRDFFDIKKDGVLYVGIELGPSGFHRVGDSITGIQYEMARELAEYLGVKLECRFESTLGGFISRLNSGDFDIVTRLVPITTELRNEVLFTEPLSLDKQVLVQRKPSDTTSVFVRSQLDLAGKTVYVSESSPFMPRLVNLSKEIGDEINIVQMPNYNHEMLSILVAKGDIDYTVCDYESASRLAKDYPQLDISTGISFSQLQAWCVRLNSPVLLDSVNAWIKQRQITVEKQNQKRK